MAIRPFSVTPYVRAGEMLAGGLLSFYSPGTTTEKDTYPTHADAVAHTNANTNPVVLDSDGWAQIWLDGQYKVIIAPSTGASFRTIDVIGDSSDDNTFPREFISGLTVGLNNGGDTDHDVVIFTGKARDGSDSEDIVLASELVKQIDAAWAVGTNAGGIDTGAVAANRAYYVWLIKRTDTGVVDALISLSATGPTLPTNYDKKRLIGHGVTDSSSNWVWVNSTGRPWQNKPGLHTDTGTQNSLAINPILPMETYSAGAEYWVYPANSIHTDTGVSPTFAVGGNAAKTLKKNIGTTTLKTARTGDIPAGIPFRVFSDSAAWILTNPPGEVVWQQTLAASNSTSLDFETGVDGTYRYMELLLFNLVPATDGDNFHLRFNQGGTYQSDTNDYFWHVAIPASDTTGYVSNVDVNPGVSGGRLNIAQNVGSATGESLSGKIFIWNVGDTTTYKAINGILVGINANGEVNHHIPAGALVTGTSAITGIRLSAQAGNITSGRGTLIAYRN